MPKKLSERKKLVRTLDNLVSRIVQHESSHKCELCGKPCTQCHHYFGRRKYSVRWDLRNLVAVCWACHRYKCHQDYEHCRDYLIKRIGEEAFYELKLKSNTPANFSLPQLREMVETFKLKLKEAS